MSCENCAALSAEVARLRNVLVDYDESHAHLDAQLYETQQRAAALSAELEQETAFRQRVMHERAALETAALRLLDEAENYNLSYEPLAEACDAMRACLTRPAPRCGCWNLVDHIADGIQHADHRAGQPGKEA